MKGLTTLTVIAACALSAQAAPPTQTVFKCVKDGKTVYTDEPCLGGKEVDATPTQGMDKSTGKSLKGPDVRRAEQRALLADALKPLTGLDSEGFERQGRRRQLPQAAYEECKRLDAEVSAKQGGNAAIDETMLTKRKRFKALGC